MILRSNRPGEPRQGVAIVPGHPLRRTLLQFCGVPEKFGDLELLDSYCRVRYRSMAMCTPSATAAHITRRSLVTLPFAYAALGRAASSRPNVIVILVDDMGFSDLACYGSEIPTP